MDQRGLTVAAPMRASLGEIDDLLHRHQQWVFKKLDEWAARASPAIEVCDGMSFPWLGEIRILRLETLSSTGRKPAALALWGPEFLTLCLKPSAAPGLAFKKALMEEARRFFSERLTRLVAQAPRPLPTPPPLLLTSARTRWGSCSSRAIRLNWRLMHFPPRVIDYVVAHELAHLVEMNHSPRFWAVLADLHPDWQEDRRELRTQARTCPLF